MSQILSDEEMMARYPELANKPKILSDEEMLAKYPELHPSILESGARGLAQGVSQGYADEITGFGEHLLTGKPYEQARDESRANYRRAEQTNPGTYATGQTAGSLASLAVPAVRAGGLALKGAAILGAGGATIADYGASENPTLGNYLRNNYKAPFEGASLAVGAPQIIGKTAEWTGKAFNSLKENAASRALGFTQGIRNQIGRKETDKLVQHALDKDLFKFGSNTERLLERSQKMHNKAGESLGNVRDELHKTGFEYDTDKILRDFAENTNKHPNRAKFDRRFKGNQSNYEEIEGDINKFGTRPGEIPQEEIDRYQDYLRMMGTKPGEIVSSPNIIQATETIPGKNQRYRIKDVEMDTMERGLNTGTNRVVVGDKVINVPRNTPIGEGPWVPGKVKVEMRDYNDPMYSAEELLSKKSPVGPRTYMPNSKFLPEDEINLRNEVKRVFNYTPPDVRKLSVHDAHTLKSDFGNTARNQWMATRPNAEIYDAARYTMKEAEREAVDQVLPSRNNQYLNDLKDYSTGEIFNKTLGRKLNAQQGNQMFGLGGKVLSSGVEGLLPKVGVTLGDKLSSTIMNQSTAAGLEKAQRAIEKFAGTSIGKSLAIAAQKGNNSLVVTYELLKKNNPEFREMENK